MKKSLERLVIGLGISAFCLIPIATNGYPIYSDYSKQAQKIVELEKSKDRETAVAYAMDCALPTSEYQSLRWGERKACQAYLERLSEPKK